MSAIDTIKQLIDKAGKSFTGLSWTSGPDYVVAALERGDTKRAAEPDSGLDVPNDGSMQWGGLRRRWEDLLRDCLAAARADEQDPAVVAVVAELLDEARDLQRENAEYVRDCAVECREGYGSSAYAALSEGDIDQAIADLEGAASVERTFGDAPSWGPALAEARAYAATLAEGDATHETGDELTAAEVEALGWPVRFEHKAQGNDGFNPQALHIYVDGSVVATSPDGGTYYAAMAEAREHFTFRDPVPSTPNEAWDRAMGFQSVHEAVANGWDPKVWVNLSPTCKDLTFDEREAVAALLAQHIAAQD